MTSLSVRERITNAMLFYPDRGQWRSPSQMGMAYDAVELTARDGVKTQAWWIPAADGREGAGPAPVLLFFHGNAGTIADRLDNAVQLRRLGVTLLMAEYRGYGDSQGEPTEVGLYADADAALAEARRRAAGAPVIVFGRSLGGAVAMDLASRQPVDGLITESTFTSLAEMAGKTGIPFAESIAAYRFASIEKIGKVAAPVLIFHGDRDEMIPFEMGTRLRDAATSSRRVDFHLVMGGTHNDTWLRGGEPYWAAWRGFVQRVREAEGRSPTTDDRQPTTEDR